VWVLHSGKRIKRRRAGWGQSGVLGGEGDRSGGDDEPEQVRTTQRELGIGGFVAGWLGGGRMWLLAPAVVTRRYLEVGW